MGDPAMGERDQRQPSYRLVRRQKGCIGARGAGDLPSAAERRRETEHFARGQQLRWNCYKRGNRGR